MTPCKDGNVRFATVPLKTLSDQVWGSMSGSFSDLIIIIIIRYQNVHNLEKLIVSIVICLLGFYISISGNPMEIII